jgi:hypothetical protein
MITFSKSIKGSSHEENGKPMQDWSEHLYLKECMADILLLSDGHGSDRHFRSDRGAKFAVEAAEMIFVGPGRGAEKLDYVMDYITRLLISKGITMDQQQVRMMIESTLLELKNSLLK